MSSAPPTRKCQRLAAELDALRAAAGLMERELAAGGDQPLWLARRAAIAEMAEECHAHIQILSERAGAERSFDPAAPARASDIA